jgi:SAM-dependent methyltransferase
VPRNWDEHYSNPDHIDFGAEPMLIQLAETLPAGSALDLASGPGRNALYLARLGWHVTAVDSSAVAIRLLLQSAHGLAIEACRADLEREEFAIAPHSYDLICDFFYLQRDLFEKIREGVKPGGVVENRAQPKKKKKKKEKTVSRRRGPKINADGVAKSKIRNRGARGPIRAVVQGGLPGLGKNR